MKIRDKQRWLSNQMSWLTRNINLIFTLVLLFSILPNCSHGFKYIALASTTSKVNATSPEIQFHVNNVTLTDNTISDNDSEEGHAKVVKTISSLLAESLNKSIGHFQYIQENRDSTSSERQLRLSLTTTTSTLTGPDEGNANNHKEPCTESRRSDDTLEDDGNSDESKSVILGNSANGLNDSIISVTLTSKTVSDGLQDDKTGPTTINPSNLVTRVTGSSILTDKLATVYYGDQDEDDTSNDSGDIQKMNNGDEMNLRKYFKPITTLPPEPSPVYQPEEAVKVVPIGQNNGNQNVNERKDKNNGTQFICIKVINGKLTYPSMAKLVYPQLKETSLVMPTVPKIPLSYLSFKKYLTNDSYNDSSTESIFNGTNDSLIELNEETKSTKQPNLFGISERQPKHYVQRYYPVDLYSLDSIQKKNVSYTLKSSLSFDPGDNETHYLNNRRRSSVTANNDATTETTTNITTTTPTIDPLVSEKSTDLNTFSRVDSDKIKYKPITYKTTVIIPKITTTTVSLSTNYPKSSSAEPMTTTPLPSSTEMSSIHSSNKIIHEFKDKKDSKYETNKKKHDKESVKSNKKSDKSTKKEIQMMNSGSSISSQRLVSSRLRFPASNSANIQSKPTSIDTSFDSFEIPSEEPIIIPNSMIRPPFGLKTIVPNGLQHQVSASNPNPFQSHRHYNNVNLHQKKYQQLSTPITVNQHSLVPEVLQSSTIMPNELTDNPLISLMNPSIGSSYRGLASKLKSAINFSPKQQQQMYPNQHSHYQNSYSFVPSSNQMNFGYNGYDQSGLESVYKLNPHSTTNDMVYYDTRLNYKPEVSLMTPYLPNLQGSYVRQPASKFLRQYQALVTSASSMVQRNPSQSIQFNHNPSQLARQPSQLQHNRQQLIPPTNFYPVFQPIQSLSLNPQTFQDPHEIHQHSNYYHQQQDLRPKVSTSIHHKLKPEHINLLEQGDSSSITSVSRASVASGSKLSSSLPSSQGSTTDDKQLSKSSRKNRSKTGSTFRSRNSRTKSKRKSKQNNLSGNSSSPAKSPKSLSTSTSLSIETFQKSSPKTLSNPCSSSDSTNCQSLGGLLFSPSRSVKFELRDALS